MTNQSLTELMNNRYPCAKILDKSDKLDLSMTVAEAKGFLIGLNYVGLISETQLDEWIDLLSKTVILWGCKECLTIGKCYHTKYVNLARLLK